MTQGTLDTGACTSVISEQLYNTIKDTCTFEEHRRTLSSCEGNKLEVLGRANFRVKIGSGVFEDTPTVVRNLSANYLFGLDVIIVIGHLTLL